MFSLEDNGDFRHLLVLSLHIWLRNYRILTVFYRNEVCHVQWGSLPCRDTMWNYRLSIAIKNSKLLLWNTFTETKTKNYKYLKFKEKFKTYAFKFWLSLFWSKVINIEGSNIILRNCDGGDLWGTPCVVQLYNLLTATQWCLKKRCFIQMDLVWC